jgi:hypothetical protein
MEETNVGEKEQQPLFDDKLFGPSQERRVFTNLTDARLVINDLEFKPGPNGMAIPKIVSLEPRETKNFSRYTDDQLRASDELRGHIKQGNLMEGRPGPDFKQPVTDQQKVRARLKEGLETFNDPSVNAYDTKLVEMLGKQDDDDLRIKIGEPGKARVKE